MRLKYGSICSGIEAAGQAWRGLGWEPGFVAEVEPFPATVLSERWNATRPKRPLDPDGAETEAGRAERLRWAAAVKAIPETGTLPNLGDFTKIERSDYDGDIDLLVGGTPCQSYSMAGLRRGLEDPRGNLTLGFAKLAYRTQARWLVWENVPGVLTSGAGRDFASYLSLLAGWEVPVPGHGWKRAGIVTNAPGCYGVAWRVLDAQYTRVPEFPGAIPQRRRRVILVGYLDSWRHPAEVLLGGEMRGGDTPPRRAKGESAPAAIAGDAGEACTIRMRGGKPGGGKGALVSRERSLTLQSSNDQTLVEVPPRKAYAEGSFAAYRETDVAASRRASSGTVGGGSETLSVEPDTPCWWDGRQASATVTTRSNGQQMPDRGQLQCVIDIRRFDGGEPGVAPTLIATDYKGGKLVCGDVCPTLDANYPAKLNNQDCSKFVCYPPGEKPDETIGFIRNDAGGMDIRGGDVLPTMRTAVTPAVVSKTGTERIVRRLMPEECERLMGMRDGYTRIPWKGKPAAACPDGPRYKCLGNSMCVNVMAWVGHRIDEVERRINSD